MKAISPVLPATPDQHEIILAKNQPQYHPLPVALVTYDDGVQSMISRYRLGWRERMKLLFTGDLWLEQLTFGAKLQPQRPTVNEPLTERSKK